MAAKFCWLFKSGKLSQKRIRSMRWHCEHIPARSSKRTETLDHTFLHTQFFVQIELEGVFLLVFCRTDKNFCIITDTFSSRQADTDKKWTAPNLSFSLQVPHPCRSRECLSSQLYPLWKDQICLFHWRPKNTFVLCSDYTTRRLRLKSVWSIETFAW